MCVRACVHMCGVTKEAKSSKEAAGASWRGADLGELTGEGERRALLVLHPSDELILEPYSTDPTVSDDMPPEPVKSGPPDEGKGRLVMSY